MMTTELSGHTIARGASHSAARIVASGGAWMIGARIARTLVTVVGMIVLARLLTPADFGVVAVVATVTLLSLVIIEGAIDPSVQRHDDLTHDGVQNMIWTALIVILSFASVLYGVAPMIEDALRFPRLGGALRGVVPVFILQVFFVTGSALLRRQHRFQIAALISVGSVVVYMVVAVVTALSGGGVWSIIIAQNVSMLLTALALVQLTAISVRWPRQFSLAAVGQVGAYGASSRVLAWFWSSIDTIAVAATLGPAAAGLYTRAYNINIQLKEPFAALDGPTRQALIAVRDRDGLVATNAVLMLRLITLAVAGVAAVGAVLREPIVMLLLGPQWRASAPVLAILLIGLPARIALNFFDGLATVAGSMPNMMLRHGVMCLVVGAGVWVAAPYGTSAVAGVVCAALYLGLLLPARHSERVMTGSRLNLIAAMLPGLSYGAALLALGEYVLVPLANGNRVAVIAIVIPVSGLTTLFVCALLPSIWLPVTLQRRRRAILMFGPRVARPAFLGSLRRLHRGGVRVPSRSKRGAT